MSETITTNEVRLHEYIEAYIINELYDSETHSLVVSELLYQVTQKLKVDTEQVAACIWDLVEDGYITYSERAIVSLVEL